MIGDGKGMVVLRMGYGDLLVPVKAAALFMDCIANGGVYKFESQWMSETKQSLETVEPADVSIHNLTLERVALAKLNGEVYRQYKEDKAAEEARSKQP